VAGQRALELVPRCTQPDLDLGVEGVQAEEVAVWPCPWGGQGPLQPLVPKSLVPSEGAPEPSPSPPAAGSMFQASQCVNVPTGASGSSTMRASVRVPGGGSLQDNAGETSSPSHVWRRGISPRSVNASLLNANSPTERA
jgi:hypothetical protein